MTNAEIVKAGASWKGMVAILLVAVMVAMSITPMVKANPTEIPIEPLTTPGETPVFLNPTTTPNTLTDKEMERRTNTPEAELPENTTSPSNPPDAISTGETNAEPTAPVQEPDPLQEPETNDPPENPTPEERGESILDNTSADLAFPPTGGSSTVPEPVVYSAPIYPTPLAVLWDNGPLVNGPGMGSGGADASILQTSLGMSLYGFGAQYTIPNRMADDFVVTGTWTIDSFTFFSYQTGSSTVSSFDGVYMQIWDGAPDGGGAVIWGDMVTNRISSTAWSNIYRVLDTNLGDTQRPIMEVVADTTGLMLPAGTYWVDFAFTGTLASGPWAPPITINGITTTGNALQWTQGSGMWNLALDTGAGTQQGVPFIIDGNQGLVVLSPAYQSEYCSFNGEQVDYPLTLTNNLPTAETFDISATGNAWPVEFLASESTLKQIENPSFETGDLTGWNTVDLTIPYVPITVSGAGNTCPDMVGAFLTAPTDGIWSLQTGWDGDGPGHIMAGQDFYVPLSGTTTLTFDYRASWDLMVIPALLDRTFSVNVEPAGGGAPLQTDLILTAVANTYVADTGILQGTADLTPFAGTTIYINFDWWVPETNSGPAYFELDNIQIAAPGILNEQFEGAFPPPGWTVIDYDGWGGIWQRNDFWGRPNYAGGSGFCADADSDWWFGPGVNTGLRTPALDFSGYPSLSLEFDQSYRDITSGGGDYSEILVSTDGGGTWTQILYQDEDHSPLGPGEHVSMSLNAFAGFPSVIIEFHYDDAGWDWWWMIDNVDVSGLVPVTSLGPIAPGDSLDFIARVTVPPGANPGDFDIADITATAGTSPPPPMPLEDFEGAFPPAGWTVIDYDSWGGVWQRNDFWGRPNYAGGSGFCADADSDAWWGPGVNTGLRTPALDFSGYSSYSLDFDQSYNDIFSGGGDYSEILVSTDGGGTWTQILYQDENHSPWGPGEHVSLSLNAFVGSPSVIIEFHYDDAGWDWWWMIDNVVVDAGPLNSNTAQVETIWPNTFPWSDDMESGPGSWTASGLWHMVDDMTSPYPNSYSPTHSWWYGQDATGDYDTGVQNSGRLETPPIDLTGVTEAWFSFAEWYETENAYPVWDQRWIQIDTGSGWTDIIQLPEDAMDTWLHTTIDLAPYCGNIVRLGFWFDTGDAGWNWYRGWYVDDVYVGPYAMDLTPDYDYGEGYWTEDVDHYFTVNNLGSLPDSYSLSAALNPWTTTFWNAAGTMPIFSTGVIPPGGSETIIVRVTVPYGVMDGTSNLAQITATSQSNPAFTWDTGRVETVARNPFGVSVSPAYQSDSGYWTEDVDYYIDVQNTGVWSDRYDLSAVGNAWPVTFWDAAGTTQIFSTSIIIAGGTQTIIARVTVPYGVMDGTTDLATIWATSQGDPVWTFDTVQVDTTALNPFGVDLTPPAQSATGYVSDHWDYTLTIDNTGVWSDRYDLSVAGNTWTTTFWNAAGTTQIFSTPIILPGATYDFIARVDIPALSPPGSWDQATITVTSQGDPVWTWATATVQTFCASPYNVELTPVWQQGFGSTGHDVDYFLLAENTGVWAESYDLTAVGNAWPVTFYGIAGNGQLLLNEQFEGAFPPAGWDVINYGGTSVWVRNDAVPRANYAGGMGFCAAADSDTPNTGDVMNTGLQTKSFSLDGDTAIASLEFDMSFNSYSGNEYGEVRISVNGGSTWSSIAYYDSDIDPWGPGTHISLDLSAYIGNPDVIVEFLYANADYDWFWQVDNVQVFTRDNADLIGPTTTIGPIAPGDSAFILARVSIPAGLGPGSWDTATVVATCHDYFYVYDTADIQTNGEPEFWFDVGPPVQTNFGWEGEWVEHRVQITNEGTQPDVYLPMFYEDVDPTVDADWWTKFFTVDLRPQGIYNGIDDGSETWWWGPVQPGETKEYAIKVFVPTDDIGAFDQARIYITSDNDGSVVREVEIWTRLSMPAPFYDDFELAGNAGEFGLYNDPILGQIHGAWTRTDDLSVGVWDGTSYTGMYAMYIGCGENLATTCKINMDIPYGIASCVIQRGGAFSDPPEAGEDLVVEYSDGNLQWAEWHELATFPGGGIPGEIFTPLWILPQDALNPRFQLRFRQADGSGPGLDYWHIDNVFIGAPESSFMLRQTSPSTTLFYDDFSTDMGWTYGTNWERGVATASTGGMFNPDPEDDHTSTADDMLAGSIIGGNVGAPEGLHPYYYLTSPVVDCSDAKTVTLGFWRWANTDYTPYMKNIIEVWDGADWNTIWETFESGTQPTDSTWTFCHYDLTPEAAGISNMQFRIGYNVDNGGVYTVSGWNIDDVIILGVPEVISGPGEIMTYEFEAQNFARHCDEYTISVQGNTWPTEVLGPVLEDDFTDLNMDGWNIVDEGVTSAPSNWFVDGAGVLRQNSNIYSYPGQWLPGTYIWNGDEAWTDYTLSADMMSTDDDGIGLMARYTNSDNYYRFHWSQQPNTWDQDFINPGFQRRVLDVCVDGAWQVLASDNVPYTVSQWYNVEMKLMGDHIQVYIDGSLVFDVTDSSHGNGAVGLYSWGNTGVYFDNVEVYGGPTLGPLGPQGPLDTGKFIVNIDVPADAVGTSDTATITATSILDPWVSETITLTTTAGRVHNLDQDTWFMDIQPAVDAANPAETLWAYPGVYEENVVVNKPLTIHGMDRDTTIVNGVEGGTGVTSDWLGYNDGHTESHLGLTAGGDITMAIELTDIELAAYRNYEICELYMSVGSDDDVFYVVNYDVWIETSLPAYGDVYTGGVNIVYSGTSSGTGWDTISIPPYAIPDTGSVVVGINFMGTISGQFPCGMDTSNTAPTPRANYITYNGYGIWNDLITVGFPGVWGLDVGVSKTDAVFNVKADSVAIDGFMIQDGPTGVLLNSVAGCDIGNNMIRNCGCGISVQDSSVNYIHDNDIFDHHSGGNPLPGSLETIFASNNQYAGNMFDVEAKVDLLITSFDVNVNTPGVTVTFEIYYKTDTYIGFETDAAAWTLIGTGSAISQGDNIPTNINIPDFDLPAGDYGFYLLQTTYPTARTRYTNGDNVYENGEMKITAGIGMTDTPFLPAATSRTWNGCVHYTIPTINSPGILVQGTHSILDDFSADSGLWTYYGNAAMTGGYCRLTQNANTLVGRILYNQQINSPFLAEFDYLAGGGTGADGMAFNFFKEDYIPVGGGSLGAQDADGTTLGYAVEFDNWDNGASDPSANHIAIIQNNVDTHLAYVNDPRTEDNVWHHAKVIVTGTDIAVYVDDMVTPVLTWAGSIDMTYGGFSFSAGTGGANNNHFVDNIYVQTGNVIENNRIHNNEIGVLLWDATYSRIFHNNFVNNGIHAIDNGDTSMWDGGYPTGGNYWKGFTGPDSFNGPLQNIPGPDGMIDNPYIIDPDSQDNYPLKAQYTTTGIVIDPITVVEEPVEEPVADPGDGTITAMPAAQPSADVAEPEIPEAAEQAAGMTDPDTAITPEETVTPAPVLDIQNEPVLENVAATPSGPYNAYLLALLAMSIIVIGMALFFKKRK